MILNEIGKLISEKCNFAIISHYSPDGDAIGSSLGLYNALKEIGKNVDIFIPDNLPNRFSYLPLFDEIKNQKQYKENYECILVLDCGDEDRLGEFVDILKHTDLVINIDHHISNTLYGNINYVDSNASSVGEIIYNLLKLNGYDISKNTACCLYTSIISDTGGFKYSNTTSMTFNIAGDLINTGIDFPEINRILFDTKSVNQIKLLSLVTSTLEMHNDDKLALIYMTRDMLNKSGASEDDASEMVNLARDIETAEVGVFIKEIDDKVFRISLRSKNIVDVRLIAEKFDGGGHVRAAGCTIKGDFAEVKKRLIDEILSQWK
ncbi:Bifunctional oligoribonuclease and PAP phosphatase NrnA [Caloramator mitchellensis]|uniref:Bifunctional oligoribonuclease and PAP phosphatase NrnA n=1 Tax=Caloramator mitchellensis TaxID=908809 RepID=A0A0R3JTZ7_CALMK|nr:bifunctional oligoribonuclease/PAP phosphatase NrnA [Caloramator mitchellensis]KRQ86993.1 Bifunctional oligoribonuclease and PAP phosphatase NrnA [Caloramator mitchellensis]